MSYLKFILLILKLQSLVVVFVGDGKLFQNISQICYNFHIFLSFASDNRSSQP